MRADSADIARVHDERCCYLKLPAVGMAVAAAILPANVHPCRADACRPTRLYPYLYPRAKA